MPQEPRRDPGSRAIWLTCATLKTAPAAWLLGPLGGRCAASDNHCYVRLLSERGGSPSLPAAVTVRGRSRGRFTGPTGPTGSTGPRAGSQAAPGCPSGSRLAPRLSLRLPVVSYGRGAKPPGQGEALRSRRESPGRAVAASKEGGAEQMEGTR